MTNGLVQRYILAIVATAGFMVMQGPGDGPIFSSSIFWVVSVTAGWLQMLLIARGVRASFGADNYSGWVLLLASALIGAIPLTFEIRWLLETVVNPEGGLSAVWMSYLRISFINLSFSVVQYLLVEQWPILTAARSDAEIQADLAEAKDAAQVPAIGKLNRKPEGLNGRIQYMQMEDHYLRVHTDDGDGLALYRMSDAVEDLADTDGMQVHRSWWVARSAVKEVKRDRHKKALVVQDGTLVPIGRSYEKRLKNAGWI